MNMNDQVFPIRTQNKGFINYGYVVLDKATRNAAIVDPAWELVKYTEMLTRLEANVHAIVLTHSHRDHVDLVEPLLQLYNPGVYMGREEINRYGYRCSNLQAVEDMDQISLGSAHFTCIHTPGHTSGGMCYLLGESIFTGDTVFIEGCGVCHLEGGSAEQMFYSIQRLKKMLAPEVRIFPGHSFGQKPGLPMHKLLEINLYFQLDNMSHFIDFRMRKNQRSMLDFK